MALPLRQNYSNYGSLDGWSSNPYQPGDSQYMGSNSYQYTPGSEDPFNPSSPFQLDFGRSMNNAMSDFGGGGAATGYGVMQPSLATGTIPDPGAGPVKAMSWRGMFGRMNPETGVYQQGWGLPALKVGTGLAQAYLGYKSLNLQKDMFKQNKKQFAANFNNQATLTNANMRDRQAARVASNPNAYQSVGSYMGQNQVQKV